MQKNIYAHGFAIIHSTVASQIVCNLSTAMIDYTALCGLKLVYKATTTGLSIFERRPVMQSSNSQGTQSPTLSPLGCTSTAEVFGMQQIRQPTAPPSECIRQAATTDRAVVCKADLSAHHPPVCFCVRTPLRISRGVFSCFVYTRGLPGRPRDRRRSSGTEHFRGCREARGKGKWKGRGRNHSVGGFFVARLAAAQRVAGSRDGALLWIVGRCGTRW